MAQATERQLKSYLKSNLDRGYGQPAALAGSGGRRVGTVHARETEERMRTFDR